MPIPDNRFGPPVEMPLINAMGGLAGSFHAHLDDRVVRTFRRAFSADDSFGEPLDTSLDEVA